MNKDKASNDTTIRIWDTSSYNCDTVYTGHAKWVMQYIKKGFFNIIFA
jgi:WD40 repeat protein